MCGRFSFYQAPETVAELFKLAGIPQIKPRYNIAPTQSVPTVLQQEETQERQFQMMRWGLIPSWSKDMKMGAKMINARSETVAEKPSFRSPFRRRRCWILADGFYEWETTDSGKQPFYFQLKEGEPFAFAGLWERWQSPEGEVIESCTILTTDSKRIDESDSCANAGDFVSYESRSLARSGNPSGGITPPPDALRFRRDDRLSCESDGEYA